MLEVIGLMRSVAVGIGSFIGFNLPPGSPVQLAENRMGYRMYRFAVCLWYGWIGRLYLKGWMDELGNMMLIWTAFIGIGLVSNLLIYFT